MEFLVLIFGVLIGSFLNVCIYRIPRKESIAFGASHCTKCGNRINSHLCPNCGENIEGSENFCERCGWSLTEKESVLKNRKTAHNTGCDYRCDCYTFCGPDNCQSYR